MPPSTGWGIESTSAPKSGEKPSRIATTAAITKTRLE